MSEENSSIVSKESDHGQSGSPPSSSTGSYHTAPSCSEVSENVQADSGSPVNRSPKLAAMLQHPLQSESSNTTIKSPSSDLEIGEFQSAHSILDPNELSSSTTPLINEMENISFLGCLSFDLDTYLLMLYLLFAFLVTVPTAHFFLGGDTDSVPSLLSRIFGWIELAMLLVFAVCLCQLLVKFLLTRHKTKMQTRIIQVHEGQRVEHPPINENSAGVALLQGIQMGQVANQLDWNFHSNAFDL